MSVQVVILSLVTLLLVFAAVILANEKWHSNVIGVSRIRLVALPVLAGLAIWGSAFATDLLKGRLTEGSIPEDNVGAFVESIQFGFPTVSSAFFERDFTSSEVQRELAPLRAVKDEVVLTADELGRLNDIASKSGELDEISRSKTITTTDIADALHEPISFGYNYSEWAIATKAWEQVLTKYPSADKRVDALKELTNAIAGTRTAAGLFQGIVGMRSREMIDIASIPGDCASSAISVVAVDKSGKNIYLEFKTFRSLIADEDDYGKRRSAAEEFASLFAMGCISTLKRIFHDASQNFQDEHQLMRKYVAEWNRILESKTSESISIRMTVANPGRFDSFIHRKAVVAIGPKGSKDKIRLMLEANDNVGVEKEDSKSPAIKSDYFGVRSRSAQTITFQGKLSSDVRQKIFGAYQSEQTFLRVGLLANAGATEVEVLSQAAPFSIQVAKLATERLQRIGIDF